MRRRSAKEDVEVPRGEDLTTQLAQELEARGVPPSFAIPVAEHLAASGRLPAHERGPVLAGVVAAYAAHQPDYEALEESARNIDEIQRLMQGFAGELSKLEEGLRVVSAYVLRMHDKANSETAKRLH